MIIVGLILFAGVSGIGETSNDAIDKSSTKIEDTASEITWGPGNDLHMEFDDYNN
jgi:hypothetical protein